MGMLTKIAVVGAGVAFARSQQGKQLIADARQRYDTPANREKARSGVAQATQAVKSQLAARKGAPGYS